SAGPASGCLQPRGSCRRGRGGALRGALRRADVLVRGDPERDERLRRGGRDGGAAYRDRVERRPAGEDRPRSGRGRGRGGGGGGLGTFRVLFPRGMDANEYAQKVTPAARSLEMAVRQATWMRRGRGPSAAASVGESESSSAAIETSASEGIKEVAAAASVP